MNNYSHIVFNHVPKCAGSSLRYMFYEACLNNKNFARYPMYIPLCTHENICLQEYNDAINVIHKDSKVFFDHSHAYFLEDTFNLNINSTYRIINIRNPIFRFISHMYFFDKISPEQCSYETLKLKTQEYGTVVINYLTQSRYKNQELDIETKLNIAKKELEKYNFIFVLEQFPHCIQKFNEINPFSLVLQEQKINLSDSANLKISKKVLYNIKTLIEPEIILLKDFYTNIDEDINQY